MMRSKQIVAAFAFAVLALTGSARANGVLEKISPPAQKMAVWGVKNPVNATEVKAAVKTLAGQMTGDGHHLIVMTGSHGTCNPPGLVATQEIKFAEEDATNLKHVKSH